MGVQSFGGPEVLGVHELPRSHAGPGQVRIRVQAAGVNPADAMLRDGSLADWYEDLEPPFVPGMDVAGVIDEVGDGAGFGLQVGQPVLGVVDNSGQHGGYSEYVVLPSASVVALSPGLSFAESASFLMNALTARTALDGLALAPGSGCS